MKKKIVKRYDTASERRKYFARMFLERCVSENMNDRK